jgi:NitT/TauT family transport system substrate-binding protein
MVKERNNMINRLKMLLKNLILICVCVPACLLSAWSSKSVAADKEITRLRATVLPYFGFAPLYIAEAEGFFADEGLAVEFVPLKGHAESLPALLRGEIDIETMFSVGLLNAISRGENIRAVAGRGTMAPNACPYSAFLVRPGKAAEISAMKAEDLRQLTFGVDPIWLDGFFLHQWLGERGLSLQDVKTKYLPAPAARLEALRQGSLDAVFVSEPWITKALESNAGELWLPASEVAPDFPLNTIAFGPSMLSRTDDAGVRFLRAYLRAVARYAEGKTPRNIEILAKATKLDADLLHRMCWPVFPLDGNIDPESIVRFSVWAHQQGLADRPLASADEIWTPEFLEKARQK